MPSVSQATLGTVPSSFPHTQQMAQFIQPTLLSAPHITNCLNVHFICGFPESIHATSHTVALPDPYELCKQFPFVYTSVKQVKN